MTHFRRDKSLRILYGMVKNSVRKESNHAQLANHSLIAGSSYHIASSVLKVWK
jgi:hypothetical protein